MRFILVIAALVRVGPLLAQPVAEASIREAVRIASDSAQAFALAKYPQLASVGLLIDRQHIATSIRRQLAPDLFSGKVFDGLPNAETFSFAEKYSCSMRMSGKSCQRAGFAYMHIAAVRMLTGDSLAIGGRYEYPLSSAASPGQGLTYETWGDFFWEAKFTRSGDAWRLVRYLVYSGPEIYKAINR